MGAIAVHHTAVDKDEKQKSDPSRKHRSPIEHRSFPIAELRVSSEGKPKITGHAAMFNSLSEPMGGFREKIAPGAFKKTLKEADVRALFNHDPNIILGRNKSGTLQLSEDDRGLAIEIDPPDTQLCRDMVLEPMRRGDISQMSFGFIPVRDTWEDDKEKGEVTRTLTEVKLFDVSPVTYPAYSETDCMVRSCDFNGSVIDFALLGRAMAKRDHGLALSEEERAILQQSIEQFTRCLQIAPGPAAHPITPEAVPDMVTLRMRLALRQRLAQ